MMEHPLDFYHFTYIYNIYIIYFYTPPINMKAIILAAGIASRLRPLTNDRPKCLLEIGNKCLLQRTFDALIANGINQFVVVTGYLHTLIEDFLTRSYLTLNITFIHNERYASTNNIYPLWLAQPAAEGEDILLLDSDILFDPAIVTRLLQSPYPDTLALNNHPLGEEEMKIIPDTQGRVKEISKTCSIEQAAGESIGIERMSSTYTRALYAELQQMIQQEGLDNIFYERAFERLIPQGHTFHILDTTDLFSTELDTVEDFNSAKQLIPSALY